MRKGREYYAQQYDKVMALHASGKSVKEIAAEMKISYSCVYHWVNELRQKPQTGALNDFVSFLQSNGPVPVIEIKQKFPKHNEFFLRARSRSLPVHRHMMQRKFGDYSIWYYLTGQEAALKARTAKFIEKYNETRKKLADALPDMKELIK